MTREPHQSSNSSDSDLIARLRSGDESALSEMMRLCSERLFIVAEITTNSPDLAMEAVQDTFVQLWESRRSLNIRDSLIGYLATITRRRALDIIRHEKMHERTSAGLARVYVTSDIGHSDNDAITALEEQELRALLQEALKALPERCREIFLLNREVGFSYEEIAKLLGISNTNVRVQMHRAARHVLQALSNRPL